MVRQPQGNGGRPGDGGAWLFGTAIYANLFATCRTQGNSRNGMMRYGVGALLVFLGLNLAPLMALGQDAAPAATNGPVATFQQQLADWKALLAKMRELQARYKVTKPADRGAIEQEFNALVDQGNQQVGALQAAAEGAYASDPTGQKEAGDLLAQFAKDAVAKDRYEEAYRVSKLLVDHGDTRPDVYSALGVSAFVINDYDTAEKYLPLAREKGALPDLGIGFLEKLPEYKQFWAKEQELRAAEAQADDLPRVLLKTTQGDITIELFENEAPLAVANFVSLVEKGFYNNLSFHRVIPGFMAQGGDPKGDGTGGPGYTIDCECEQPNHRNHFRGTLSMAHAGRNTGGSQFFLTFVPTPHLNGQHTAFGRVIDGWEVLSKIRRTEPRKTGEPDRIVEAKVLRKRDHAYEPKTNAATP